MRFRTYDDTPRFGNDYAAVRAFLVDLDDINFPFGRWDWMISHSMLQPEGLQRIGLWEDDGQLVALATYDTRLDGKCFLPYRASHSHLLTEMLEYGLGALAVDGRARVLVGDDDLAARRAAQAIGLAPTPYQDRDSVIDIDSVIGTDAGRVGPRLPPGFAIASMRDVPDYYRYGEVLWKGFDHERNGEGPYAPSPAQLLGFRAEFERPNVNPDLKIAVVAPNGDFVAYCGMWQDPGTPSALVEPVATDPAYRRLGLGRAAVIEAVRRCGELGAVRAYVDSSQEFYYRIGFRPALTSTFWERV